MAANIHPTAIIEDGAQLGADVEIGPYCFVGANAQLGDRVKLHNHATVTGQTEVDEDCEIFPGAVIGAAAQILNADLSKGRTSVGKRCVIREHVTIHGGSPKDRFLTEIGDDCLLMVGSHVAHDCIIGDACVFANNVAIGGHVVMGDQVWLGGACAVHQFCRLGDHSFIGGGAIVVADVIPFGSVIGNHAHLAGLNTIGLKRRGFSRATIHGLRAFYRMLFADEGTFSERLRDVEEAYAELPEAMQIIEFIKAADNRALCMPE